MGHKIRRIYKYVLARPKEGTSVPLWWPRCDGQGEIAWVYLDDDMLSWSLIPGSTNRIRIGDVAQAKQIFMDENDEIELEFLTMDAKGDRRGCTKTL